jgi:hypothetical protein
LSDAKYGSWEVPESPVDVEYSLVVIEEIRQSVAEGFQRLSRGGMEVGGVLYGAHDGRHLRIQATRPIACEHANGPTFHLSEKDLAALTAQLQQAENDPRLAGMQVLGWFLSHTRTAVNLQASDLETYQAFFPEPWQVTLVIHPGRGGAMRAGFFVREPDGTVKTEGSYLEFNFPDRLAGILDRPARERPSVSRYVAPPPSEETPSKDVRTFDAPTFGQPSIPPYQPYATEVSDKPARTMPWTIIAIVVAVILAGILGLRYFGSNNIAEPVGLAVLEREGQLQIQWNRNAPALANTSRASLEIIDGTDKRIVALSVQDLTKGNFTYARKSGDVQVRLVLERSSGERIEEGSRFLGTAPQTVDANEMDLLKVQRDALQDEVTRLRQETQQQAERIQQLERTLTVLRSRLGIDQGKR